MSEQVRTVHEVADGLRRRSEGDWSAADGCWARHLVVWHCFDDREIHIDGHKRGAHSTAKLQAFARGMPDFRRTSVFHVCDATSSIVEVSHWSGTMDGAAEVVGVDGLRIEFDSCTIYTVESGEIIRLDIWDDSASSRGFAELTAYGILGRSEAR